MIMTCPPETSTTLHPVGRPLSRAPSPRDVCDRRESRDGNANLFGLTMTRRSPSVVRAGKELPQSNGSNSGSTRKSMPMQVSSSRSLSSIAANRGTNTSPPRAFSDTAVCMRRLSSSSSARRNLSRTNATFSFVQRSGAPMIRDTITAIDHKIKGATLTPSQTTNSPHVELTALANYSRDAYYRVIAAASGGLAFVVQAMSTFEDDEETQASGCAALESICVNNASNQAAAGQSGALRTVLAAMARFPSSIAVQGSGCDALDALTSMTPRNVELLLEYGELNVEEILEGALGRFIPPSCRMRVEAVLRRVAALR
mmetsp:Transcript_3328/g.8616  ORF Transcript_3328/g.8616 Transcript_3328/m.8616 type:complete len:314 (-) Transcript_3328:209-1150(-)